MTLLLLLLLGWLGLAQAAVTFDDDSTASGENTGSLAWNHTVGSGCTQPLLFICVGWSDAVVTQATGVTYNSVAATFLAGTPVGESVRRVEAWRLVNPTVGSSQEIEVTLPDASINEVVGAAVSYCGVDQSTPLGTPASAASDSTPVTVNVSSATGDLVIDCAMSVSDTIAVGAGQTLRATISGSGEVELGSSSEPGAATVTMSWTQTPGTNYWGTIGVALKPGAATTRRRFMALYP